jgi:hypothetical protein
MKLVESWRTLSYRYEDDNIFTDSDQYKILQTRQDICDEEGRCGNQVWLLHMRHASDIGRDTQFIHVPEPAAMGHEVGHGVRNEGAGLSPLDVLRILPMM